MTDEQNNNPLVEISDLTGLSKPATALVNRLADACGLVYKPLWTILRAKANAKAELIKMQASIDAATLEGRAAIRIGREQMREQANLEIIIAKAVREMVGYNVAPEGEMDDDWLCHFVNKAKHVSKQYMQDWWARILAGEVQSPGSFSLKTLEIVSVMGQGDAESFRDACSFVILDSDHAAPLILDMAAPVYNDNGVTFDSLQHLASLGLVSLTLPSVQSIFDEKGQEVKMKGNGFSLAGKLPKNQNTLITGPVLFTDFGLELASICEAKFVAEFPGYLIEQYKQIGYVISRSW